MIDLMVVRAGLRGERARAAAVRAVTAPPSAEGSRRALLGTVSGSCAPRWAPHGTGRPELAQAGGRMALSALCPPAPTRFLVLTALRPWRRSRTA
ncbi:hypothetical protein GCM10010388_56070 [Streptomyces mauvecolor]